MRRYTIILIVLASLSACTSNLKNREHSDQNNIELDKILVKHATSFGIDYLDKYSAIISVINPNTQDTVGRYGIGAIADKRNMVYLRNFPAESVAALSASFVGAMQELNALQQVIAIDNNNYLVTQKLVDFVSENNIPSLSKSNQLDIEQCIQLNPNLVLQFQGNSEIRTQNSLLDKAGIDVFITTDYLETSPLGRAEWIKIIGLLTGNTAKANAVFNEVEKAYLASKLNATKTGPSALLGICYDAWYVPGGQSYTAKLLADAGINYLWKDIEQSGTLPLSPEEVIDKAISADYWFNVGSFQSRDEMKVNNAIYSRFDSFTKGKIYNNNKNQNAFGCIEYWETGVWHPEQVLSELISITSADSNSLNNFSYYQCIY